MREIKEAILKLSANDAKQGAIFAEVLTVTDGTCTAQPFEDLPEIVGIRLQGQEEVKGIFCKPKVGSTVIVHFIENEPYIVMFSELDSIILRADSFGGLVKVEQLTTKLTNLENKLNDLITACTSQIVTLAPSGTFPLSSFFTSVTPLTPTERVNLENTNVKHG